MYRLFATFSILLLLFVSCKNEKEYGYVRLSFEHHWEDSPIQLDGDTPYTNLAENVLTFERLEYFISNLELHSGARVVKINLPSNIRYINNDPAHSDILLTYQIPTGNYDQIRFTFGLNEADNQSGIFRNPPESNMWWPPNMGGGYHYMKIDGRWRNKEGTTTPFGLHLGALEQPVYDTFFYNYPQRDSIIRIDTTIVKFHHYFPVTISESFTVHSNQVTTVRPIIMDVKQWMERPNIWDFNVMGGEIMSRNGALDSLAENGRSGVFR
jgi:hypothetical protein